MQKSAKAKTGAEKLDGIIGKINLILEKNLELAETVQILKQKLKESDNERKLLTAKNEGLENEMQLMKMAKSVKVSGDERVEMKKELKKYIREIDKCLALLNK